VQVSNTKGKTKRTRFGIGKRKDWKKAYVRLSEGNDINFLGTE
jgi:large subunit ribosomal protein L23